MVRLESRIGLIAALQAAWPFVRHERPLLARAAAATLLLAVVEISVPLLSRSYLDWVTGGQRVAAFGFPQWLPSLALTLLLGAAFARGGLLTWQRSLNGQIGERTAARLRTRLWSHLQALPVDETQRRGSGRLLVRFVSDIRTVQRLVTEVLIQGTQDIVVAGVILSIMAALNWWMALPSLLLVPTYAAAFWLLNPTLRQHSRAARRQRTRLSAFLNERILGLKVVKAQVQERSERTRVRQLTRVAAKRGARLAAAAATIQGVAATAVTCSLAFTLALAAGEVSAGRVTTGTLVAFVMLIGLLAPVLRRIARLNRTAQEAHVSLARLSTTLAQRPEIEPDQESRPLRVREGHLKIRQLSFAEADGAPVLDRISLDARRGEIVALVGPRGSGKSTLLDLVLRFKQPTSGRIVIDGRRIENVSLASLRAQIGWVPQEAPLFDGTIRHNVTYGTGRPSRARLKRALRVSGVEQVAARLPDGLNTRVGTGGRVLSPGERQCVAFARVLIAAPPILLLDEPSSGGDAEADRALAKTLRSLARKRTVVVATHQLPILEVADRIYVFEHGRLVEKGDHRRLLKAEGVYARLVGARPAAASDASSRSKRRAATRPGRQARGPAPTDPAPTDSECPAIGVGAEA